MQNSIVVSGSIQGDLLLVYERRRNYYKGKISVARKSGEQDVLNFYIREDVYDEEIISDGNVTLEGEIKTFNYRGDDKKTHLFVYIDVNYLEVCEAEECLNEVCLEGYICKSPTIRDTPLGKKISDIIIAVNGNFGETYYIPCICWGSNARYVANKCRVGDRVYISGRFQSRKYKEDKITYEVSVSTIMK